MSVRTSIRNQARNLADFVREQNERSFRTILLLPSKATRRARIRADIENINNFKVDEAWREFQSRPRREAILDSVLRFVHHPYIRIKHGMIDPIVTAVTLWWALNIALPRARSFTITSFHQHYAGYHNEAEVYLRFGRHALSFHICNGQWMNNIAEESWLQGESGEPGNYGNKFSLIVPMGDFDNEVITQAIKNWYMDRYYWKYRHWSHREGQLPEFTNEVAWNPAPANLQSTEQSRPAIHDYLEQRGNEMKAAFGQAAAK